jgi:hypothetical protein
LIGYKIISMDRLLKCPKCKSKDLEVVELWEGHGIVFEQNAKGLVSPVGDLHPGDPYKVEARCLRCKHKWAIRKATQISNIYPSTLEDQ